MASRLGTVYVELSLDDKIYKQKLADIEPNAVATARGVETAWRALGTKSSEYFDQQRKAAENAYRLIEKSGKYSAEEVIRAERAKNETIERLNTQQFGKQTSLISNLKEHWLAATAAITAAYMTAQKAWSMAEQAAKYEQSAQAFRSMATSMGKDATTEFEKIRKASGGMIDVQTLVEASNKAMSLGIPIEKIGDLMLIARAKARDMGTDAAQAFSDIATGVGRASPLILDNLGLVMKVGSANEAMAASLGKTVEQLTDQEKKTAILNATLAAGKEALARYNLEEKTTAEQMQSLKASLADVQLVLGQGIVRAAALVVGSFQSLSAASMTVSAGVWKIIEAKERLVAFASFGETEKRHMDLAKEAAQNAASDFKASIDYATKAQGNFALMTSSQAAMANATKAHGAAAKETGKAQVQASEDAAKASGKAADDIKRDQEKIAQAAKKRGEEIIDSYYAEKRAAENYYDRLEEDSKRVQAKRAEDAKRKGQDIIDAYYDEQRKAEDYYRKIDTSATESGAHRVQVEVDVFGRMSQIEKDKLLAAGGFFDGVKLGYEDITTSATTFGKLGYDAMWEFANSSKSAISDVLFDSIKTGTVDTQAIWDTFSGNILRTFTDAVGEMVTQAAMNKINMMFTASWAEGASEVLGIIGKIVGWADDLIGGGGGGYDTGGVTDPGLLGGMANGGQYAPGKPFWAGERGPELIFPGNQGGYVLTHQQSMAYASGMGGVPGYADGTGQTAVQIAVYNSLIDQYRNMTGFGITGAQVDVRMADSRIPNYYGIVVLPSGEVVDQRQHKGPSTFGKILGAVAPAFMAAAAAYTGNVYFAGMVAAGMAKGKGASDMEALMAAAAAAAATYAGGSVPQGGGLQALSSISQATGKNILPGLIKSVATSMLSGDQPGINFGFGGAQGDLSWLTSGMAAIAPQSKGVNINPFRAKDGLDYVPYDNFPALLHKGERVETAKEARESRGGGGITINITCPLSGKTITKYIYDETRAGKKIVHSRGVTNV